MAEEGGSKRRYQYCSDGSGTIFYLRALQGHSGHNLIDPTLQDNVLIQCGIFHHIYHIGCALKITKILNKLTSRYHVERDTCTVHGRNVKTRYCGSILIFRLKRDYHSIKHDRMQLSFKEHFQLIVFKKVVRLKTGEVLYEKPYISPRPPPKISLRHDHDWTRGNDELDSTVEQQPVGKLVQQSVGEIQHVKFSKRTQPKPKPICDRSGKPEDTEDVRRGQRVQPCNQRGEH